MCRIGLKRVQAGHLLGSSLKQLAGLHLDLPGGKKAEGAEAALRAALPALQDSTDQARMQLEQHSKAPADKGDAAGEAAQRGGQLAAPYPAHAVLDLPPSRRLPVYLC